MIKFLDLAHQYQSIKSEIDDAIFSVINKSAFIGGDYVAAFEEQFATFQDAKFCIGVGNGTDALEIAIEALEIKKGSEIIVPANSFIATSEAVTRSGCKVVFCDCDPENYTISTDDLMEKITPETSAIIAVHLYGHPCDMDSLLKIAREYNLKIIEDCAQAHGAEYKDKRVGAIGDIGTFSFYPGKNLGAYGDGGAIVTNNESLAVKCRMIANHGRVAKYDHEFEGRNSRLDGLQAAILSVKLKYLEDWLEKRINIADYYLNKLENVGDIILPKISSNVRHVFHLFVIRTEQRDNLITHLNNNNIQTGIHYPISLPKLKAYKYCAQYNDKMFANEMDETYLSLPIGEHLHDQDFAKVTEIISDFYT